MLQTVFVKTLESIDHNVGVQYLKSKRAFNNVNQSCVTQGAMLH